jgi:hypothetical protein
MSYTEVRGVRYAVTATQAPFVVETTICGHDQCVAGQDCTVWVEPYAERPRLEALSPLHETYRSGAWGRRAFRNTLKPGLDR